MTKETLIEMCNKKADMLDNDVNTGRRMACEATNIFGGYLLAMKDITEEKLNIFIDDELASIFVDRATRFTDAEEKRLDWENKEIKKKLKRETQEEA